MSLLSLLSQSFTNGWFHIKAPRKTWIFLLLDFLPKKSKVFDILVIKTFFNKQKTGFFLPLLELVKIFVLIFEGFKSEIVNIMFDYSFSCQKRYTFCHRSRSLLILIFFFFFWKGHFCCVTNFCPFYVFSHISILQKWPILKTLAIFKF